MRLLLWHMDRFVAEPTERGRSRLADAPARAVRVGESLVVFVAAERADEPDAAAVAGRATAAITRIAEQVGARTIVLHSFSHLFVELAAPEVARQMLADIEGRLRAAGYTTEQTAFGWFNRLEMTAKGHPLSRVARQV